MAASASCNNNIVLITFLLAFALLAATVSAAKEIESHLHLYYHYMQTGPNATALLVAEAPSAKANASATGFEFGAVYVMDDPLTDGPNLSSSRLLGHGQGVFVSDSMDSLSLLMAMNFVFVDGAYNGSSIAIFGANIVSSPVRELPVVGGTGVFRFARGYCQLRTYKFDPSTGIAIVEYSIHVRHEE